MIILNENTYFPTFYTINMFGVSNVEKFLSISYDKIMNKVIFKWSPLKGF